jgi:CRISPR-associated protein Csb3
MNCDSAIRVGVDVSNTGQFFAACGLLELADRLWNGVEGWFETGAFCLSRLDRDASGTSLTNLLIAIKDASLRQVNSEDSYSSPLELGPPFHLRIDWWTDSYSGSNALKVWAGSMQSPRIARAMQKAIPAEKDNDYDLFARGEVVYDPDDQGKKVEPFYFDSRRGSAARPIDIGFSPDPLQLTTLAHPAVEFLCFVGLQRFRPKSTSSRRVFEFHTWSVPLDARIACLAACGILPGAITSAYRFESIFRTDQRKHKAFGASIPA